MPHYFSDLNKASMIVTGMTVALTNKIQMLKVGKSVWYPPCMC